MSHAPCASALPDVATVRALEDNAFNAWPALRTVYFQGWMFRFAEGYTKRANSVNPIAPQGSFEAVLDAANTIYTAQGLPLVFRITPLAGPDPDGILERDGFEMMDEALVMTAPITAGRPEDLCVSISSIPDIAWSAGFAAANGLNTARRRAHDHLLAAIRPPKACAMLRLGHRMAGYALAVADNDRVGLFDLVVTPEARRRGIGRRLVAALLDWGARQGATTAYLQVMRGNAPARSLYESFDFQESYRYHYRVKG
jgi:ribosomal protein S18 acetylase RimI-like enzyme